VKSKVSLERIVTVGLSLVVAAFVVALATGSLTTDESSGAKPYVSRLAPVEFLYLDGSRILGYLAQLEGGRVGAVHRISKEIRSVSGEAPVAAAKIGASAQYENQADSTITRTESSALGLMVNDIEEDDEPGVELHKVKQIDTTAGLAEMKEGWLVKFKTRNLLSPGYIRPYVVLKQSATLAALFPRALGNEEDAEHSDEQKANAQIFAHQIGPDPRITFAVEPKLKPGKARVTVLLPMHYRGLTSERSLLEKDRHRYTGGRLTVIGKVIRIFPGEETCVDHPDRKSCLHQVQYTDFATREIWQHPLEQASNYLVNHVSHNCAVLVSKEKKKGRACFLANLEEQTQLRAPGAVILPIAVYK
jgi:hypothetical protein